MTKPKEEHPRDAKTKKDPPSAVRPRVVPQGDDGHGSVGNLRDSRRGRDLTPSKSNDPDAQESKA